MSLEYLVLLNDYLKSINNVPIKFFAKIFLAVKNLKKIVSINMFKSF